MATPYPRSSEDEPAVHAEQDDSIGDIVNEVIEDTQKLLRQELALAKAEVREEATKAGKAAGMLSGAGFAGYMVIVLVTFSAVFGLGAFIGLAWSALIVAAVWAVIGAVLFFLGRSRMRTVSPQPRQTIETLKEDAQWARHPTR